MDSIRRMTQYFFPGSQQATTSTAKTAPHQASVISHEGKLSEEAEQIQTVSGKIKTPDSGPSSKPLSGSKTSIGATVHVDHKALAASHTGKTEEPISLTRAEQKNLTKQQDELYDIIVANLSHKPDFDHEATRHTIDVGLRALHINAKAGIAQGVTLKLGDTHIISYFGKKGELKHIPWPGLENLDMEHIIGEGGKSIVFQVGYQAKPKILKGSLDAEESTPIIHIRDTLKSLHAAHEGGTVSGLEHTPKIIQVATGEIDPTTGEPEFFVGALTRRYEGDLTKVGPDTDTGNLPKKVWLAERFGNLFHTVAFMHDRALPHRDIKPENILFDEKGFYLSDFGDVLPANQWTDKNYKFGTAEYITNRDLLALDAAFKANNLEEAQTVREKMDVFAMGATMYKVLTGRDINGQFFPTFDTGTLDTSRYVRGAKQSLIDVETKYGKEFLTLLMATLQPDLSKRPSAAECEAFLQQIEQ